MQIYTSLILAGLTVSFLHAILPTHWLPFVLAGRAQRWTLGRTLWIAVLAGGGHVLMTTLLGVIIVWAGVTLSSYIEIWSVPITAGILALFGAYYIVSHLRGGTHHHHHHHISALETEQDHDDCEHESHSHHSGHGEVPKRTFSPDTVAVTSLIALLAFSPCEGFLPIYLSAMPYGWTAFAVLAGVLAVGTLTGMILFTGLTYAGVRRLKLTWLEHYEDLLLGSVLIILAAAVVLFHHY